MQAWAARTHRPAQTLGRLGSLEVRLARTAAEVRQAQKLRYRVFYQEGSAIPNPGRLVARRDVDAYDAICDHLLVLDHAARDGRPGRPAVVGTYRLLRQPLAEDYGGFYTAGEFDIGGLIARHPDLQFLELGRSCVLAPYRNKRTVELLWHGISGYLLQHPTRRDDRLRQPRRAPIPSSSRCRSRSCTIMRARRSNGAPARCPSAMSR